ncbi:MAG: FecR domain-containing protein [Verrucomicrobiaceae bacterium]
MNREDEQLIQNLLDGDMAPEEFDQFQDRLRKDPDLRAGYLSYSHLYHSLDEMGESLNIAKIESLPQAAPLSLSAPTPFPAKKRKFPAIPAAIAAVLTLSGIMAWQAGKSSPAAIPPALATFGPEAAWEATDASGTSISSNEIPAEGTLTLTRGTTQLELAQGVTAWIHAPATLRYLNPLHLELDHGRAHFHVTEAGHGFTVTSGDLEIVDLGTRFGLLANPGQPREVHVLDGEVTTAAAGTTRNLLAGQAIQLQPNGVMESLPADKTLFPDSLPREILVFRDSFGHAPGALSGQRPSSGKGPWVVTKGRPQLDGDHFLGGLGDMEVYGQLNAPRLSNDQPILLVTLQTSPSSSFHSAGWAGLSLYQGNEEIVFFGDCHGDPATWGLDVRRHGAPRLPETPVSGARPVTLRYDYRTGALALFHGPQARSKPFLETVIRPEIAFDRIRLSHGDGGELNVDQLVVKILQKK